MQTPTKLTLRLDSALIDRAKIYAHDQDRSVSQLVADYFRRLTDEPQSSRKAPLRKSVKAQPLGPVTSSLRGALAGSKTPAKTVKSRDDYRRYLEDKHL